MRYEKGHKETTRRRIVEMAAERFRKEGIANVGVASLMSEIGLTQGGFYNHFDSKDDLAREALAMGLKTCASACAMQAPRPVRLAWKVW